MSKRKTWQLHNAHSLTPLRVHCQLSLLLSDIRIIPTCCLLLFLGVYLSSISPIHGRQWVGHVVYSIYSHQHQLQRASQQATLQVARHSMTMVDFLLLDIILLLPSLLSPHPSLAPHHPFHDHTNLPLSQLNWIASFSITTLLSMYLSLSLSTPFFSVAVSFMRGTSLFWLFGPWHNDGHAQSDGACISMYLCLFSEKWQRTTSPFRFKLHAVGFFEMVYIFVLDIQGLVPSCGSTK